MNRNQSDHVVVDLPLRLRPEEVQRLEAAVSRAPATHPEAAVAWSHTEIKHARTRAMALVALRRERERQFEDVPFSDPSWDLLLMLFIHRVDAQPANISSICNAVGAPQSTAFRYLSMLVEKGWVTRRNSDGDHGITYVTLSNEASDRMISLLKQ